MSTVNNQAELVGSLGRLAGNTRLEAAGAAYGFATPMYPEDIPASHHAELVGALNKRAGTTGLELAGVANYLAGTTGLEAQGALQRVFWPDGLSLPGTVGAYASTPDVAVLDIAQPSFLIRCALTDWTPATDMTLVAKWNETGNQRSYGLQVLTTGVLRVLVSTAGTAATVVSADSTVAVPFSNGQMGWVQAVIRPSGPNTVVDFETGTTATDDGSAVTLAALGATGVALGAGDVQAFSSSAVLEVGSYNSGANGNLIGTIRVAVVAGPDPKALPIFGADPPSSAFRTFTARAAGTGETWSLFGAAALLESDGPPA